MKPGDTVVLYPLITSFLLSLRWITSEHKQSVGGSMTLPIKRNQNLHIPQLSLPTLLSVMLHFKTVYRIFSPMKILRIRIDTFDINEPSQSFSLLFQLCIYALY